MKEWISVKDILPSKYSRVLVTDGKEVCVHYKQSRVNFDDERGYDLYCGGKYDDCNIYEGMVTHWMPLPEPPELNE